MHFLWCLSTLAWTPSSTNDFPRGDRLFFYWQNSIHCWKLHFSRFKVPTTAVLLKIQVFWYGTVCWLIQLPMFWWNTTNVVCASVCVCVCKNKSKHFKYWFIPMIQNYSVNFRVNLTHLIIWWLLRRVKWQSHDQ